MNLDLSIDASIANQLRETTKETLQDLSGAALVFGWVVYVPATAAIAVFALVETIARLVTSLFCLVIGDLSASQAFLISARTSFLSSGMFLFDLFHAPLSEKPHQAVSCLNLFKLAMKNLGNDVVDLPIQALSIELERKHLTYSLTSGKSIILQKVDNTLRFPHPDGRIYADCKISNMLYSIAIEGNIVSIARDDKGITKGFLITTEKAGAETKTYLPDLAIETFVARMTPNQKRKFLKNLINMGSTQIQNNLDAVAQICWELMGISRDQFDRLELGTPDFLLAFVDQLNIDVIHNAIKEAGIIPRLLKSQNSPV